MAHFWGDEWEYWDDLGEAVEMVFKLASDAGMATYNIKEKFGSLRWYISPQSEDDKVAYRAIYEAAVEVYPHLAAELLGHADCHELLVGIVDPDECEHGIIWTQYKADGERSYCGVCGEERNNLDKIG